MGNFYSNEKDVQEVTRPAILMENIQMPDDWMIDMEKLSLMAKYQKR